MQHQWVRDADAEEPGRAGKAGKASVAGLVVTSIAAPGFLERNLELLSEANDLGATKFNQGGLDKQLPTAGFGIFKHKIKGLEKFTTVVRV